MKFDHMSQNFKSIKLKEERLPKTKNNPKHHTNVPLRYNKASLLIKCQFVIVWTLHLFELNIFYELSSQEISALKGAQGLI